MNILEIFDSRKTLNLLGLKENLDFLINLDNLKKLPKVLMISGKKGVGKSTLISHFLNYKFDAINYDKENNIIKKKRFFL